MTQLMLMLLRSLSMSMRPKTAPLLLQELLPYSNMDRKATTFQLLVFVDSTINRRTILLMIIGDKYHAAITIRDVAADDVIKDDVVMMSIWVL